MSRARTLFAALAVPAFAALGATGCTATVEPAPTAVIVPNQPDGTLVVDWSISSRKDPGDCTLSAADSIQIHITTLDAIDAGIFSQVCGAFATSIALVPGTYQASALLVDVAGQPRTTSVPIQPFTIVGGDQINIPIDFPADSFF